MERSDIIRWLREERPETLQVLWETADRVRSAEVGDEVHLRGLIEISNHCRRSCLYCGLRRENSGLRRYRMSEQEILECALKAEELGFGAVVLQSGEDLWFDEGRIASIIRRIKERTALAVTLSLGERRAEEYALWQAVGADRYLLRFETSRSELFERIHPPLERGSAGRISLLRLLRRLGYETGGGVMVGIPGQTLEDLADDILTFNRLELDMIGVGPYIPHPGTPLAAEPPAPVDQAPASDLMTYKVLALARLICPQANIPATTALATVNRENGREMALMRGANIVMPNLTPARYRALYEIYPDKACVSETVDICFSCLKGRVESIGRCVGAGRGDSPGFRLKKALTISAQEN